MTDDKFYLSHLQLAGITLWASWSVLVAYRLVEFLGFQGRFQEFRVYHNFANLCSKLLDSTLYMDISKLVKSKEINVLD